MISEKAIDNIRTYGTCAGTGDRRSQVLAEIDFPRGKKAEYVIIGGCFQPEGMPHVLKALKNILDYFKVSYTLLEKEHCCGWMSIGQPAVFAKNEEDIADFRKISCDFITQNFKQAKELGAKTIVLFCGACEPNYTNYRDLTDLEIITYSELIDRYFKGGTLNGEIDYYAGCYRFRRRITDKPVDVEPAVRVLDKIEGLKVNFLDNKLCCYVPPHMDQLTSMLQTGSIVNICTGCYFNLKARLKDTAGIRVKMLPEIVWEALQK